MLRNGSKAGDEVAKLLWENAELLKKAREFGADAPNTPLTPNVVKGKAFLDEESKNMGAAQKLQDWKKAKQHLDMMLKLAQAITGGK